MTPTPSSRTSKHGSRSPRRNKQRGKANGVSSLSSSPAPPSFLTDAMADSPNPLGQLDLEPIEASIELPPLALERVDNELKDLAKSREEMEEESGLGRFLQAGRTGDGQDIPSETPLMSFDDDDGMAPAELLEDHGAVSPSQPEPSLAWDVDEEASSRRPSPSPSRLHPVTIQSYLNPPRSRFTPTSTGLSTITSFSPTAPKISDITTSRVTANAVSTSKPSEHPPSFVDSDEEEDVMEIPSRHPPEDRAKSDSDALFRTVRYPSFSASQARTHERIVFASFSTLGRRLLLFLGYESGLQVWDTTRLDSMYEILNVRSFVAGRGQECCVQADVLPAPTAGTDSYKLDRPLIGVIMQGNAGLVQLSAYSLHTQRVVKTFDFVQARVVEFQANARFIVVSTTDPVSLHIISSFNLDILYTISSDDLALSPSLRQRNASSSPNQSETTDSQSHKSLPNPPLLVPTFALSSRLLAFASTSPSSSSPSSPTTTSFSPTTGVKLGPITMPVPAAVNTMTHMTQADFGNAAMKVGGGLLSGMKALGGMAVAAARASASGAGTNVDIGSDVTGGGGRKSSFGSMFFSKSAPAAAGKHERRLSHGSSVGGDDGRREIVGAFDPVGDDALGATSRRIRSGASPVTVPMAWVIVVDLQPLITHRNRMQTRGEMSNEPRIITQFVAFQNQPCIGLSFSQDGTCIAVTPRDGTLVRTFQIRPLPHVITGTSTDGSEKERIQREDIRQTGGIGGRGRRRSSVGVSDSGRLRRLSGGALVQPANSSDNEDASVPWHIYSLRRGRTTGVIEDVVWAGDARWVAIGTRKRTVHVFATNPYGGKPDEASHLDGKVKNVTTMQPLSTEISPIVRIRVKPLVSLDQAVAPVVFTFLPLTPSVLPPNLLPTSTAFNSQSSSKPVSVQSSPRKQPQSLSPGLKPHQQCPTNYQDLLMFDPVDGSLALHRITISTRSSRDLDTSTLSASLISALPLPGGTSMSFPGMGMLGRTSTSPPARNTSGTPSALSRMMERREEAVKVLLAKETLVASWGLLRSLGWTELREVIKEEGEKAVSAKQVSRRSRAEWLSHAELSTSSRSLQVLPGSIYLSHQFSFHAFGEDYHALIRRTRFDIPIEKIHVRKEVEASAQVSSTHGEGFIQAGTSPQNIRRGRSSFDEPLASAISAGMDYGGSSPPVIPMFPNGTPGARAGSSSFKASIPIKHVAVGLSDSMNEGFGRLKREIGKVRSPRLVPRSEGSSGLAGSVPLEFDEEDEDFMLEHERLMPFGEQDEDGERSTSRGGDDSLESSSAPSTNAAPGGHEVEAWEGWEEDAQAVEEAERYDEISAAGFMDEEQMSMRIASEQRRKVKRN